MGHNNAIRNDDGIIETKLWEVTKDASGNDRIIGGVKVISNPTAKRENDLPIESNTAEAYFKADVNGDLLQLRVYDKVTHKAVMDIDIGSEHGKDFPIGLAHVQEFYTGKNGKPKRRKDARLMTEAEIDKWGYLIKLANPNVRFKP